jgi:hypothetical protein
LLIPVSASTDDDSRDHYGDNDFPCLIHTF